VKLIDRMPSISAARSKSKEKNIFVIGCTGDGKSATANQLIRVLEPGTSKMPFSESASATSHTHAVKEYSVEWQGVQMVIHDTPGLMDSKGVEQDEVNIAKIVEAAREKGEISALVLVLNEKAKRFNSGMQAAVKLFFDAFGPECFNVMGIAYTHADGNISLDEAQDHAISVAELLESRTGTEIEHVPCWQLENHPEAVLQNQHMQKIMKKAGLLEALKEELEAGTIQACGDLLRWARTNTPLKTSAAKVSTYEYREQQKNMEKAKAETEKRLQEETKLKKEAEAKAEEAAKQQKKAEDEIKDLQKSVESLKLSAQQAALQAMQMPMFSGGGMDLGGSMGPCGPSYDRYPRPRDYAPSPTPSIASSRGARAGSSWNYYRSNVWQRGSGTMSDMRAGYRQWKANR
jgi:ABC-type oligopeptide transport system ATPase subunit